MRGSPFTFSNFSLGLNVLDSPYTLKQGEARDCLNVVSTPRGAIQKRRGSQVFAAAGGVGASFPVLAVTDSFKRAAEKPLKKDGKGNETAWEILGKDANTGEINGTEEWVGTGVTQSGALYNVKQETNPAVSVEIKGLSASFGYEFRLLIAQKTSEVEGYALVVNKKATKVTLIKVFGKGEETALATVPITEWEAKDIAGLTLRAGVVTGWRKRSGVWVRVVEAADNTWTKGYGALEAEGKAGLGLVNFSVGEANEGAAVLNSVAFSLAPVTISGVGYLIGAAGTKLFSVTESGEVSVIKEGLTESTSPQPLQWSVVQAATGTRVAQGPVYMSNGTDPPLYWTGAAKNTEAKAWTSNPAKEEFADISKTNPKYLVYFSNRVWAAGFPAAKAEEWKNEGESALRWSGSAVIEKLEVADPTQWPVKSVAWFDKDDGSPITGLGVVGPYLLVFKAHKTWVVYGVEPGAEGENRRISDSTGCVASRSIVETPLGTFFLSPDQGVFITNGAKVQEMSRNVRPILQGTDPVVSHAARQDRLHLAAAGYLNGHYYLSYTAQDNSMKTLDYDVQLKSWWLHDLAGNQWVVWEPAANSASLYTIPNMVNAGVVKAFVPGVYTDSGVSYAGKTFEVLQHNGETVSETLTAYWASCWEPFWQYFMRHRFQQPQIKKRIRTLFVDAGGGREAVEHKGEVEGYAWRNFGTKPQRLLGVVEKGDIATEATYTPKPGNAETEYQAVRFYSLGTGRVWSFMFANTTGEPFEVDTYAADLYFRKA